MKPNGSDFFKEKVTWYDDPASIDDLVTSASAFSSCRTLSSPPLALSHGVHLGRFHAAAFSGGVDPPKRNTDGGFRGIEAIRRRRENKNVKDQGAYKKKTNYDEDGLVEICDTACGVEADPVNPGLVVMRRARDKIRDIRVGSEVGSGIGDERAECVFQRWDL